jgi:hypothetical protein
MMTDTRKILRSMIDAATLVLPLIDPKKGKAAVAAAEALRHLVEEAKGLAAGPRDVAALEALQAKVNAHADATTARLRAAD